LTTIVIDLDGTLANCEHRQQHAQNGDWDMFHSLLAGDRPYADVAWLLSCMHGEYQVVAVTGRNEAHRSATLNWFHEQGIGQIDVILMRPDNDYTPDHILKPRMLEVYIGSKQETLDEVIFVLDDRDKVVDAWREYGLNCWQVRQGTY
jgi:hypothetical protein